MKFAERSLILLGLIGWYLALWKSPADLSVLFVAAGGLSVLYMFCMYPLLKGITLKLLLSKTGVRQIKIPDLLLGFLFGALNGYCVFSIVYQRLKQMSSLALAENCGIFLLLFAIIAYWRFRKEDNVFYKRMLMRIGIWSALIVLAIIFRP